MIIIAGEGKKFEANLETSANEQQIFFHRNRDVDPTAIKKGKSVPKNKFDCLLFHKSHLFPLELKSTKSKSISFSESIIKAYQIESLHKAAQFPGVIAGFLFNFREPTDQTYFVHINDFVKLKHISENELPHTYKGRVNKSSISISICEEIGTQVTSVKKVKNYRYYINNLLDELIEKYQ